MEIKLSFWKREPYVKMSIDEYREMAGNRDEQGKRDEHDAPVYNEFPKVELLKDGKGEVYAYRVGGVTSTEPPMCVSRSGLVIW